jgi:glucose-1-phosphate adenylyltransferase
MEHIGSGRPWEFDQADRTLRFMTPFVGVDEIRWFRGTGDAIAKNINLLHSPALDEVLILSGEHVYRMDYRKLIHHHRSTGADLTMACVVIPPEQQHPRFGNVVAKGGGRVEAFIEKPECPVSSLVSMGIYCFKREVLMDLLKPFTPTRREFSLAGDVLQPNIGKLNVQAYISYNPWYYLANLREYFDFHMQLASGEIELFNDSWNIITNFADRNLGSRMPAFFAPECEALRSIISSGCKIYGTVRNSVLSPGVVVERGAVVSDAVIFHDTRIGAGCRVEGAVIDKDVVLEAGAKIGGDANATARQAGERPIAVLAKGARLPSGERIAAGAGIG